MTIDVHDRLMTLPELAEMLGVPITTVYAWRSRGQEPAGLSRADHGQRRAGLCRKYREVRDFELTRLDVERLTRHGLLS